MSGRILTGKESTQPAAVLQQRRDRARLKVPDCGSQPVVCHSYTDADTWLTSGERHVLVGEPGSAKWTFSTRRPCRAGPSGSVTGFRSSTSSLRDPLDMRVQTRRSLRRKQAWLEQNGVGYLWDLADLALKDGRLAQQRLTNNHARYP